MEATKKINSYRGQRKANAFIFFLALCALTFVGCKKDSKPADVLSKKELSALMLDLYLAEARLSFYPIQRDSSLKLFLPRENAILAKRNVPDSILRKTYAYYLDHPDDFNEVYDLMIDSLTVMEKAKVEVPAKK